MTLDADLVRGRCSEIEQSLDYERVFDAIENDLDDLRDFSRIVASLV